MQSNKSVVIFILKFFGTYFLLFILYSTYLDKTQLTTAPYSCAPITETVANQTKWLLDLIGYETVIEKHPEELSLKLIVRNQYLATIVEGCNAMSIIILFISFIVAFAGKIKTTFLYILIGSLLIYVVNIIRIAIISICLLKYPEYQYFIHDILFPGIIYGMTILLWFIWIRKFSKIKK